MPNTIPLISVLMSVYNGEKFLKEAMESILSQTLPSFEFIIFDDASTDSTRAILQSFSDPRLKLINNEINIGLTKSLNKGLALAKGKFIARMDADDIALPDRLKTQVSYLNGHPDIALVGSWAEVIDEWGQTKKIDKPPVDPRVIEYELIFGNPIYHSSIMFRRDEIIQAGGYSEEYRHIEDFEMYSRLVNRFKIANIPRVLLRFRTHPHSIVATAESQKIVNANALKIIRNNMEKFVRLSDKQFIAMRDAFINKTINPSMKISDLCLAYQTHKKIYATFLKARKTRPETAAIIKRQYKRRRSLMIKKFLIGKKIRVKNLLSI